MEGEGRQQSVTRKAEKEGTLRSALVDRCTSLTLRCVAKTAASRCPFVTVASRSARRQVLNPLRLPLSSPQADFKVKMRRSIHRELTLHTCAVSFRFLVEKADVLSKSLSRDQFLKIWERTYHASLGFDKGPVLSVHLLIESARVA